MSVYQFCRITRRFRRNRFNPRFINFLILLLERVVSSIMQSSQIPLSASITTGLFISVTAKIPGCAVRPQDVLAGVVSLLPTLLDAD